MLFDQLFFLLQFLPATLVAYYLALQVERFARGWLGWASNLSAWALVAAGASFVWWSGTSFVRLPSPGPPFVSAGILVVACHLVSYVVDIGRRQASFEDRPSVAWYLLQFPLLVAGPIVRFRDISVQRARRAVSMGAFTYGVRRVVTGLMKVVLVAGTIAGPANAIFARPADELAFDVAWLGAICFSLQIYFQYSGYSDIAIGLGRILGFRYPENFRRPYTADSVRDFWRHWNITLVTWLRDYLYLPIAGRDEPTPRLYVNIVAGFLLIGLWHGARGTVLVWSVYSGMWLALEAVGLGAWLARLPRLVRHVYLLTVVVVGWVILRAGSLAAAGAFLEAMAGGHGMAALTAQRYLGVGGWMALATAVLFAGPLVPWISRWRVSVDAATASLLMIVTAMAVFAWRPVSAAIDVVRNRKPLVPCLFVALALACAASATPRQVAGVRAAVSGPSVPPR